MIADDRSVPLLLVTVSATSRAQGPLVSSVVVLTSVSNQTGAAAVPAPLGSLSVVTTRSSALVVVSVALSSAPLAATLVLATVTEPLGLSVIRLEATRSMVPLPSKLLDVTRDRPLALVWVIVTPVCVMPVVGPTLLVTVSVREPLALTTV